ncbi:hypothetical protein H5410_058499 [Solanum commersonii]|uniref:Response regulatory domain-containing protein n=1 Tax=Solanum commersonii TaxID=4109 RepID=A0A9J5WSV2_SOLCO|nr:hypothetical protein H5410_058499 [Solanum commersonii]
MNIKIFFLYNVLSNIFFSLKRQRKGKRKLNEVKKLSVLIVANYEISLNSYILCLQNFGAETLGVTNGFMSFNIHDKTQMRFDLILMSSNMPIMDGFFFDYKATKKLRTMGITTMIVGIITPDDNEEYHKKIMEAGLMNAMRSH